MNESATILIVDDVQANLDTLRELLDKPSYTLLEARDGPTALRLAQEWLPDLVLLDVMMPGMDGFAVCRELRALPLLAEVPVIMITALDEPASRVAGLDAGADDFITKPFNSLELRARVRGVVRLNRYRRLHDAQLALLDSDKHFGALFQSVPVAVYSCDVKGELQDSNPRALALWGREPCLGPDGDRWTGAFRTFDSEGRLILPEDSAMARVCAGQLSAVEDLEVTLERPDGTRFQISLCIVPIRGEAGEISCAIASFQDISGRKRMEQSIRSNQEWLSAFFDQTATGIVELDLSTRKYIRFNRRFCEFLGYTETEMGRLNLRDLTYAPDLPADLDFFRQIEAGELREYSREKRFVRKNGEIVWANVAVSSVGPMGHRPTSLVAVVLDITQRKRLDEHFIRSQKMEALGQFSGGVAHDFNNILGAIGGYTELSQLVLKDNPQVRSHLGAVLKATGRAADLVRQILTFSRREPQQRIPLQLQPLILECLKLMQATIPSTVTVVTEFEPKLSSILGNASQIHQLLMNLGINSWHAMKDGTGELRIGLERFQVSAEFAATKPGLQQGEYIRLSVSDNGRGMSPETLRRIFEPFFTTKAPGVGTGLGLSAVHGIMDNHEGAVTVQSELGVGTVFRLYFPSSATLATTEVLAEEVAVRGNGERILVVDDEESLAHLMTMTLLSLGYEVESSSTPVEALALVHANPGRFRLILSDQTMPHLTGLSLAKEIRLTQPDLPVILMTGYSLSLTAERAEEAGVRQVLLKPIPLSLLAGAVRAAIQGTEPVGRATHSPYR